MGYKILVTPIAQTQFEEAITYYLKVATANVALNFSNVVEKAYSKLEINPHFQIRVKNYRAIPTEIFPYLIFFEILEEENIVKILSVFNTHQNPKKYP